MHSLNFFDHENISTLLQIHDFFGRNIFHLPWELFNKNDGISMKILFRSKFCVQMNQSGTKYIFFKDFVLLLT